MGSHIKAVFNTHGEYVGKKQLGLDLGCGIRKTPDDEQTTWLGIDNRKFPGVDYLLHLGSDPLPFPDNTISSIRSIHLFEHLFSDELFQVMDECYRVITPSGTLHIEVPKAMTKAYFIHPDHKLQFIEDTFGFFQVPGNEAHEDPHGYIKGFWHVQILPNGNPENITAEMSPNKKNNPRFPYIEIKNNYATLGA